MMLRQRIRSIALPSIVSNLTIPLLSLTDTFIAGHLGTLSLGAIAVGGTMFSLLYNAFNFLRMGTGGFTSQALGHGHRRELFRILVRAFSMALLVGLLLWGFRGVWGNLLFGWIGATAEVTQIASVYFEILIYGAPAVLCTYVFTGWFLGMQDARTPMYIAVMQNVVNILVSVGCVYGMNMGVEGLAVGTLVAQYAGVLAYGGVWYVRHCAGWKAVDVLLAFRHGKSRFMQVNRDIFLRTLCITVVQFLFTSFGARFGDCTLAANALLMQFFIIQSYVMDGLAYAGEAIGGQLYGARDWEKFIRLKHLLFRYGIFVALSFTVFFAAGGKGLLWLLTDVESVRMEALVYLPYAVLLPLAGMAAFLLDGIFIGCTATTKMLWSMLTSAITFGVGVLCLTPLWGNHGLWLSFLCFLLVRGAMEWWMFPQLVGASKA